MERTWSSHPACCAWRATEAPLIVLTVTPNSGLDHVLFLGALAAGRRQQATGSAEAMGGKGCDVSLILRALDEPTTALALVGGARGERVQTWLTEAGVVTDFIWTPGQTRLNTVLIETETMRHTTICVEGLRPRNVDAARLLERIRRHSEAASAIAICGSLPEGLEPAYYTEMVEAARAAGKPVVVDASGDCLLAALEAGPTAVKPNRQELESVSAAPIGSPEEAVQAARRLLDRGAEIVAASLGHEGAVLVTREVALFAPPLPVKPINPAGAGDGMVAMLALGLGRNAPLEVTFARAVATATAITTTPGTAECPAALARELVQQVQLVDLSGC